MRKEKKRKRKYRIPVVNQTGMGREDLESSRAYYVTEENVSKFLPLQASSSYSFKARERNT